MTEESGTLMLELESVSLDYDSKKVNFDHGVHHVLDNVSLKLYEGETLGIISRNGVGKTTMLRLMAGILAPSNGSIWQRPGKSSSLLTIGLGLRPEHQVAKPEDKYFAFFTYFNFLHPAMLFLFAS